MNLTAQIVLGMPKTPVSVTGNICAPNSVEIPFQGMVGFDVQKKVPYFLIGTQVGSLPSLTIENNIQIDAFPTIGASFIVVGPTYPPIVNPAWDAATMAMFRVSVTSTKSGATAPCNDKSGVTFTVPNHPEAVVKYGGNGTSTGGGGDANAWITVVTNGTLQAPEYVTVVATKPSCVVALEASAGFFITGRIPVAINASTAELGLEISN